jgi:gliding motility-associated-like protein
LKKVFLGLLVLLLSIESTKATHLMGGEITWVCLPNGQFQFTMKGYRDCNSGVVTIDVSNGLEVFNYPTTGSPTFSIPLNLISQTDISPQCNGTGPTITCATPNGAAGAVEEFIFQTAPVTLTGTPPPEGWVFSYDGCCRNSAITNILNAGNEGFVLRAKMFAYNGQNTNPCFDSSPQFIEKPATIICAGYPFTYNHNAVDSELDSLSYQWSDALDDFFGAWTSANPAQLTYIAPYSPNNPLPNQSFNPSNVPAQLNINTGEVSFTSFTPGNFVTIVKVEAWKCGILVAEIYREIQVTILAGCAQNTKPIVAPPGGIFTGFDATVTAGDLVTFNLSGIDPEFLPNGNPQTVTINSTGSQYGTGFTNTGAGCLNPPCATLNPPPIISGPQGAGTTFTWQTDCNHIAYNDICATTSNTYTFVFRVADDFCPAPAVSIITVSITVEAWATVPPPSFRCVSVLPNGDVQLTWVPPADPENRFNSYHIYESTTEAGPYTVIDSVFNINTTTYTHTGAGANATSHYYYIRTRSGCNGEVFTEPTDTLQSILLDVTNPGTGSAALSWNALSTPLPTTTYSGYYRIYREFPTGTWVLIDSTQGLTYDDEITLCDAFINYRVEIEDDEGCISVSSVDGDLFEDLTPPASPSIDSVSVDVLAGLNQAGIGWNVNPSGDTEGYIIYQNINNSWTPIDTVWGLNNTYYLNGNSAAGTISETYRIAAIDSCDNTSPLGDIHSSIFLGVNVDICLRQANLSWNAYTGWGNGVSQYEVYYSQDGGTRTLAGSVGGTTTTFIHQNLTANSIYCYYVRAWDASQTKSAASNDTCILAEIPVAPLFTYIRTVTVPQTGGVDLYAHVDTAADVIEYKISRSEDNVLFTSVGTTPFTNLPTIYYSDNTALSSERSYYYNVIAVDSCGADVDTSEYARTIHLVALGKADRKNYLNWNHYEGWLGNVAAYTIYRSIDGVFDIVPLATVAPSDTFYVDNVADIVEGNGTFCYYIYALEDAGNPFGFLETSTSNVACAYQLPNFFVPNAFAPDGLNQIFIPVTLFVADENYTMEIYTRWGEQIFMTQDKYAGWNGILDGKLVPQGVYVYSFHFQSAAGFEYTRTGTVTLLR